MLVMSRPSMSHPKIDCGINVRAAKRILSVPCDRRQLSNDEMEWLMDYGSWLMALRLAY